MISVWTYFDKIYCINLLTRDDRYEAACKVFDKLDIPVEFHRVHKHPNGGVQGCFESHIEVIRKAYRENAQTVVIFEDDAIPSSNYDVKLLEIAVRFMKFNDTWDIFYLGPTPEIRRHRTKGTLYPNVYKIHSLTTHAYVISRRMMKKMKDAKFAGIPIDVVYLHNNNAYAIYPGLFIQSEAGTDIGGAFATTLGKIPGGAAAYYRFLEMYSYYVNIPLIIWIALLFAVWYVFVLWKPNRRLLQTSIFVALLILMIVLSL